MQYKNELAEGKYANKIKQKGENGFAMTAQGEYYLVIIDKE